MHYRLHQLKRLPGKLFKSVIWGFQRARRGYSEADWWSIDSHIANILAQTLPEYVKRNSGVNINYIEGEGDEAFERALAKRNEEYLKYADFFRRYADGGIWNEAETAQELNGVTPEEYEDAMEWLSKNFAGLWH